MLNYVIITGENKFAFFLHLGVKKIKGYVSKPKD